MRIYARRWPRVVIEGKDYSTRLLQSAATGGGLQLLLGDLLETDHLVALELVDDLVENRAARKRRDGLVGAVWENLHCSKILIVHQSTISILAVDKVQAGPAPVREGNASHTEITRDANSATLNSKSNLCMAVILFIGEQ